MSETGSGDAGDDDAIPGEDDDLLGTIRSVVAEEGARPDPPAKARSPLTRWRDDAEADAAPAPTPAEAAPAAPLLLDPALKVRDGAAGVAAAAQPDLARVVHGAIEAAIPTIVERTAVQVLESGGGTLLEDRVRDALEAELARIAEERLPDMLAPLVRRLVAAEMARALRAAAGELSGEDDPATPIR